MPYSESDLDKLYPEMTFQEACNALGEPRQLIESGESLVIPGLGVGSEQSQVYEWRDGNTAIRVLFTDGTLNDKALINLEAAP